MQKIYENLYSHIEQESMVTPSEYTKLQELSAAIRDSFDYPDGVRAVLLYGAGLWDKDDMGDKVWDLYILVESLSDVSDSIMQNLLGKALPPNVYYIDTPIKCKYAVMTVSQFKKNCKGKALRPQIWARFAQPCKLLYVANDEVKKSIIESLANALLVFAHKTVPFLKTTVKLSSKYFWVKGLEETYRNELRSERKNRQQIIYKKSKESLDTRFNIIEPVIKAQNLGDDKQRKISIARRYLAKSIQFLQLLKTSLTFEGGVDYALWKVERHSGVTVEVTDFQRKYPLIGGWPVLWKLYKAGALK